MCRRSLPFTLLFLQLLVLFSCSDESTDPQHQAQALLIWTGDPATDAGCGFFIRIDQTDFKPSNEYIIPKTMKAEEPIAVLVTYRSLSNVVKFSCSRGADAVGEGIRLYSIQKKE